MGVYFADACIQHWPNILNIEIGGAGARTLSMYRGWAFLIQTAVATKGVLRPMAPRIFTPTASGETLLGLLLSASPGLAMGHPAKNVQGAKSLYTRSWEGFPLSWVRICRKCYYFLENN